jgi:hypothetical protein
MPTTRLASMFGQTLANGTRDKRTFLAAVSGSLAVIAPPQTLNEIVWTRLRSCSRPSLMSVRKGFAVFFTARESVISGRHVSSRRTQEQFQTCLRSLARMAAAGRTLGRVPDPIFAYLGAAFCTSAFLWDD